MFYILFTCIQVRFYVDMGKGIMTFNFSEKEKARKYVVVFKEDKFKIQNGLLVHKHSPCNHGKQLTN